MTRKIFYKLTKEQEEDCKKFQKIKKIENTSISDFMIDSFSMMATKAQENLTILVNQKELTKLEIEQEDFGSVVKDLKGEGDLKVVIFTGDKIPEGMLLAFKISNIMVKKKKEGTPHQIFEDYLQEYIKSQFDFIHNFVIEYELRQEAEAAKAETKKIEMEQEKQKVKEKALAS
jgi:hypothetical protein